MAKITIKDVAREAGVSISTVSNALNGVDVLNPETKSHVLKVAERLNYVPNLNGKLLKSGQTKMLGFSLQVYRVRISISWLSQCLANVIVLGMG